MTEYDIAGDECEDVSEHRRIGDGAWYIGERLYVGIEQGHVLLFCVELAELVEMIADAVIVSYSPSIEFGLLAVGLLVVEETEEVCIEVVGVVGAVEYSPRSVVGNLFHHFVVVNEDGQSSGDSLYDGDAESIVVGSIEEGIQLVKDSGDIAPTTEEVNFVELVLLAEGEAVVVSPWLVGIALAHKIEVEGVVVVVES